MSSPVSPPPWVTAAPIRHRRRHRIVFAAAGAYNIAWGLFTVACPQWLFQLAGMPPANHPQIFATLGMVIGLYGILYLAVGAYPEHGWLCAAVGLTGKILGPIGLAVLLTTGTWPPATIILCLTNDVVWWVPFGQYLRDARPGALVRRTPTGPDRRPSVNPRAATATLRPRREHPQASPRQRASEPSAAKRPPMPVPAPGLAMPCSG